MNVLFLTLLNVMFTFKYFSCFHLYLYRSDCVSFRFVSLQFYVAFRFVWFRLCILNICIVPILYRSDCVLFRFVSIRLCIVQIVYRSDFVSSRFVSFRLCIVQICIVPIVYHSDLYRSDCLPFRFVSYCFGCFIIFNFV